MKFSFRAFPLIVILAAAFLQPVGADPSPGVPGLAGTAHVVAATERAANDEEALARAKVTGNDIVVFQRGSDWNRLGETLYHEIWEKDDFVKERGAGVELVAVDHPQMVCGRAVQGQCTAVFCEVTATCFTGE